MKLREIAYARSGDKGSSANIGVIAYDEKGYHTIKKHLTEERVKSYFSELGVTDVIRYELPNLLAFNFVLKDILDGGASRSLRIDPQGKMLGQQLLQMELYSSEILSS